MFEVINLFLFISRLSEFPFFEYTHLLETDYLIGNKNNYYFRLFRLATDY
jgi:hypothetical protein